MRSRTLHVFLVMAIAAIVAGCDSEAPTVAESVRPIRVFTVSEVAEGQQRRFSGIIEAIDSSSLSFEVGGQVLRVLVNQGDAVQRGQVLATLDEEPYRLNVRAAEADLQRARAHLAQARSEFERNSRLLERRAVAQLQFEVSQREFQSAQSQVDFAIAKLSLAQRDLRNTTLTAPFDGMIAERLVDPFTQVAPGQTLFRMDAAGGMQAAFGVPETTIGQISLGMPATVTVPRALKPIQARISEISSAAGPGNVFPVKAALIAPPPTVRSGMTAEVSLTLGQTPTGTSYFVPLTAIAAGDAPGEGFVFIYDPTTSTVRRTRVMANGPLTQNRVAVTGLNVGDRIANAGVNFLVDGQQVRLVQPAFETPPS